MNAPRTLLAAALVAGALAVPRIRVGSTGRAPRPSNTPVSVYNPAAGGRTDQQFWGQATWLNPLSGLNLDRTSAAR
jgi:hypothetical protein